VGEVEEAEVERQRGEVFDLAGGDPLGALVHPVALEHPLGCHADHSAEGPLQ